MLDLCEFMSGELLLPDIELGLDSFSWDGLLLCAKILWLEDTVIVIRLFAGSVDLLLELLVMIVVVLERWFFGGFVEF